MAGLSLAMAAPLSAGIEYVIHITVDGLRGDTLLAAMTANPAAYPNFIKIKNEGAATFNARCDFDYSETMPNHAGIVTARPVTAPTGSPPAVAHAYSSNGYAGTATTGDSLHKLGSAAYSYKSSTFDMVHDRGLSTALFGGKSRMDLFTHSYNATKGAADAVAPGGDNGRNKIDFSAVADAGSAATLAAVKNNFVATITTNTLRNYNLIHFTDTDTGATGGGHLAGWESTAWKTAASDVDGYLGAIFSAIAGKPGYVGKVALVLTADHGGGGGGTGPGLTPDKNHADASSIKNYTIPVLLWGAGIPAGINAYTLFKNRSDPGATRPTAAPSFRQPLRNTDTGNIAMTLLGAPPITGSFFQPQIEDTPTVIQAGNSVTIRWPKYLTGYQLQTSPSLLSSTWTPVPGVPSETAMEYEITLPVLASRQFWRLSRPE